VIRGFKNEKQKVLCTAKVTSTKFEVLFRKYSPMFAPLHCNFWNHKHLYHFTEKIATDRRIQLLQVQGPIFREIKTQLLFILFLKFNFLKPEKVRKEKLRG
jgi:hypothetical protein